MTRIGRLINHTGIEELPQLFNVLLGEMSIVGPRLYVDGVSDFPQVNLLSSIKPGILDWAGPTQFRTTEQRINDDLFYAAKRSHFLDIKTILAALFAEKGIKPMLRLCGAILRKCKSVVEGEADPKSYDGATCENIVRQFYPFSMNLYPAPK